MLGLVLRFRLLRRFDFRSPLAVESVHLLPAAFSKAVIQALMDVRELFGHRATEPRLLNNFLPDIVNDVPDESRKPVLEGSAATAVPHGPSPHFLLAVLLPGSMMNNIS